METALTHRRTVLLSSLLVATGIGSLLIAPAAHAADFYVDSAASGSNDGTSWSNAWESFGDINWTAVAAGDSVFISGGDSGRVYNETLTIEASGQSGVPILIVAAQQPGHDGPVVIDGQDTRANGIFVEAQRYLHISGLEVRNHTNPEVRIRGKSGSSYDPSQAASHILIDRMRYYITGRAGVFMETSDHITVAESVFETPDYVARQTDGIYSQRNHDNIYEHNVIVITNGHADGHDDGIQMFEDTNITIRHNYIEQDNNKVSNAQGIFMTNSFGQFVVYGNVVYGPNTKNCLLTLLLIDKGDASLWAYNNTLVGGGWGVLYVEDTPDSLIMNNVIVTYQSGGTLPRIAGTPTPPSNWDHNLYYNPDSSTFDANTGHKTFDSWQSAGFDVHGAYGDPRFEDVGARDFRLREDSPGVDMGADLGSPYDVDYDGVQRPQQGGWDVGAFEYSDGAAGAAGAAGMGGTGGTAGQAGSAGSSGASGEAGSAGFAGEAGSSGSGGNGTAGGSGQASNAGSSGDGGAPDAASGSEDDGGCSCRLQGTAPSSGLPWWLAALCGVVSLGLRKRFA